MVKKITILIVLFAKCILGGDVEKTYQKANILFNKGEINQALTEYEKINPKTALVWYNMAACHQLLNACEQAHATLLKAQKLGDSSLYYKTKVIEFNLYESANWQSLSKQFLIYIGKLCAPIIWYIMLCIFWITLVFALFFNDLRYRKYLVSLSCIGFFLIGFMLINLHQELENSYAITKGSISLYRGPGLNFSQCGTIETNQKVFIQERGKEWCKIAIAEKNGWIQEQFLIILDELI